ncbi:MAG TPA: DNA polymerase III subunit delta, partial [Gammaproteobacteria bacterium]
MRIAPSQLDLRRPLAPVYLVAGDEPLQQTETLDQLRQAAREQGYAEREVFDADGSGFDWNAFLAAGANLSLFAARRLFELRVGEGAIGNEGAAAVLSYCAQPPADVVLLIVCNRYDSALKRGRWCNACDAAGVVVEVQVPKGNQLPGWIARRMRSRGLQPDAAATALLAERVEGNLMAAAQEIDKLLLLHGSGPVDADAVLRATTDSARYGVYDLVDAALGGQLARSLRILDGLRGEGTAETLVVWALAREVRGLAAMAREVARGQPVARVLQSHRVWSSRQGLVGAAL